MDNTLLTHTALIEECCGYRNSFFPDSKGEHACNRDFCTYICTYIRITEVVCRSIYSGLYIRQFICTSVHTSIYVYTAPYSSARYWDTHNRTDIAI